MADSPFNPDTGATDQEKITSFLSQLLPALDNVMATGVEMGFGRVLNAQMNMGGGNIPFGSASVTGPQNTGLNALGFLNNQALSSVMQASASTVNEAEFDQRSRWQQALHFRDLDQSDMMAGRAGNLTNLAASFAFNQAQPQQLMAGLQEAGQYLGAGFGTSSGQIAMNQQVSQFNNSITNAFLQSQSGGAGQRFGLNGGGLGVLVSELARTGAVSAADLNDPMQSGFIDRLRQYDKSVMDSSQLLQGSTTQRMDQLNALTGADFLQTFGEHGSPMLRNLAATGAVVGLQPQQLVGLATASAQLSQRFGLESFGSLSNAQVIGESIGAFRQAGLGGAFIQEPRLRQTFIRRVTGAQQSRLARDISGAYALVEGESGTEEADRFVGGLDGVLTGGDVADRLNAFSDSFADVTAGTLRNVSFTDSAERARARGVATRTALRSNIGLVEAGRRAIISRRLGGVTDVDSIFRQLEESGGVTIGNLESALSGVVDIDAKERANIIGDISTRFEVQAQQTGLGNRQEADAIIRTTNARNSLELIASRSGDRTRIQDIFQGRGAVAGFRNLSNLFRDGNSLTIGGVVNHLRGGNVDIKGGDSLRALGGSNSIRTLFEQLNNIKEGDITDDIQRAKLGLGALIEGGLTGRIEGDVLSSETQAEVRELLRDETLDIEKAKTFFDTTFSGSTKRRELLVGAEAFRLGNRYNNDPAKRNSKSVQSNLKDSARTLLENLELQKLDFETIDKDNKDKFLKSLALESQIIENFAGDDVKTQRAEFEKAFANKTDLYSFKDLQELKEREDIGNKDISLSGTRGGVEGILHQILGTFQKLINDKIEVKVVDDNGSKPTKPSNIGT